MIQYAIGAIGVFLWSFATGYREGYTWTQNRARLDFLDYHAWRMVEQLGIVLIAYGLSGAKGMLLYVGLNWSLLYTVYEPVLDYMVTGRWTWFKNHNPYTICGFKLNQGRVYQMFMTVIGVAAVCIAIFI